MPASLHLEKALHRALGEPASKELLTMFATRDSEFGDLRGDISSVKADVAELRHEMRVGFERLRSDFVERIEQRYADQMKWAFIFWVGAVTTIAVLFRTLR